jgi:hypothetical protein
MTHRLQASAVRGQNLTWCIPQYRCALYPLIQYLQFTAAWKKFKNQRNKRFISFKMQPKCTQYLTHLPLPPYPCFPAELASILLLAFLLFALVAVLSSVCIQKALIYQLNFTVFMFVT